jgi:hypothetical protein
MDTKIIDEILDKNIKDYDKALMGIKQCLSAYEGQCNDLIKLITECHTIESADRYFDILYDIQGKLSSLLFAREITIGQKLTKLTKEFDRLYDPYIREYWFKRFHAGERWPA